MRFVWLFFYRRAVKKNGGRQVCFNCFRSLTMHDDYCHTLVITTHYRVAILCSTCDYKIGFNEKLFLYRQWFKRYSGLPADMWDIVKGRIAEETLSDDLGL
jgi:hypothetical protein